MLPVEGNVQSARSQSGRPVQVGDAVLPSAVLSGRGRQIGRTEGFLQLAVTEPVLRDHVLPIVAHQSFPDDLFGLVVATDTEKPAGRLLHQPVSKG